MSEGTGDKFVVLSENFNAASWAAEDSDAEQDRGKASYKDVKPVKTAWGNAALQPSKAPDLTTIFAEETQKAEEAKLKAPKGAGGVYRPPRGQPGNNRPYGQNERQEGPGGQQHYNERRPEITREKLPIPNEPPFTAFVGNLSFEVTDEMLKGFFGELGILSIKIMEENGNPRGYAYIEFESQDGLKKALMASGSEFCGRTLNMDVAKPSRSKQERYDTTWGPGANKPSYGNRPSYNNRPGPPSNYGGVARSNTERPRGPMYPSAKPPSVQANELHENYAKPKGSFENPFGTATLDHKKMDELAQQRLKNELERDKRDRERKEEQIRQQQQQQPRRPIVSSPRENDQPKTAQSWRKPGTGGTGIGTGGGGGLPPRREEPAKPKKQLIQDEDGFFSKGHRNREVREASQSNEVEQPQQQQQQQQQQRPNYPKTKKNNNSEKIDDSNIFASLTELND